MIDFKALSTFERDIVLRTTGVGGWVQEEDLNGRPLKERNYSTFLGK